MSDPVISVVTPTFRRPQPLAEAVQSVVGQSGHPLEMLVLDDSPEGSARATVEALGDPRVRYIHREHPTGGVPARVRNEGWQQAKGKYVHFLDDDDRLAPGALAALVEALEQHPERGVAFGIVEPFGDDAQVLADQRAYFIDATRRARLAQKTGSRRWMVANMLFKPTVLVNSVCMIRRELIEPVGGYDETLEVFEDVDFYLRAIRRYGAVFVDRVILQYRTGAPSIMHNLKDQRRADDCYQRMQQRYRREQGPLEFVTLKLFSRTILSVL